jgi:hypothetical protein
MDNAGAGIAAEQCPLRSAQHFEACHVEQLAAREARAAEIDLVDVIADRLVVEVVGFGDDTDAADEEGGEQVVFLDLPTPGSAGPAR